MTKVITAEANAPIAAPDESEFQTGRILTIVGAHFIHDIYTAFVAPLLPLLIDKLSLTLTQAGSLSAFLQLPSLLNVIIGYVADQIDLRYFIIFAPAVTATLISVLGLTSGYIPLVLLFFVAGISVAAFHVPAPPMISGISGQQVGKGMSFFMAGGELGRTVGPLLVTWGLTMWGLEGIWRLAVFGWLASAMLYWRLRHAEAKTVRKRANIRAILPQFRRLFFPLAGFMFFRNFLAVSLSVYLVVLLESEGLSLQEASFALALYFFAGVGGALAGGTLSDRVGRKRTITFTLTASALLLLLFLSVDGWVIVPVLVLLGLASRSITPVVQAVVLEQFPEYQATASGLFTFVAFVLRPVVTLIIGMIGDAVDLRAAFLVSAFAALVALAFLYKIPILETAPEENVS